MAGRRRRAPSTSTVATVDDDAIQYYKETTVLKPVPARADTDDWPCFLLADATVYHPNGTLANLLHVDLEGPFILRGRVEIEKDQERFFVNRQARNKSPYIQTKSTVSFSIGLKEEGLSIPVLWASGEAGWYEIVPSDRYMAVCDFMFQGVLLHYAVLDQYEEALEKLQKKKKNRNKTIHDVNLPLDQVLFRYAVTVGDGTTLPEAYDRCTQQAIFLLSHFPKGTEFYNWLASTSPDIQQKLAEKGSKKKAQVSGPTPFQAIDYPTREKSSSLEVPEVKRRGRPPLRDSATRSTRNSERVWADIVELPNDEQPSQEDKQKVVKRKSPTDARLESTANADIVMVDASNVIPPRQPAQQVSRMDETSTNPDVESSLSALLGALNDIRENMLQSMREGKQKKHPDQVSPSSWHTKVYLECRIKVYQAATEVCLYYVRDLARLLGPEWHQSLFYKWVKDNVNKEPTFELVSKEDCQNLARRAKKPHRTDRDDREAKANTQPAMPVAANSGKQPAKRGRPSGKAAGLRPSTGSKKRLRHEVFDDDMDVDDDGIPRRTSKKSRFFTDDENDEEAQHTVSSGDEDEQIQTKDGPLTRVVIRAEKLPSTTPKGPNQTWTCEEPDCVYVVRAADEEAGQDLINAHYEEHEKEAQDVTEEAALNKVNLAVQESRGHLPINHLLDKIRGLDEKTRKREEAEINGAPVPQPIKRTLLV